MDQTNKVLLGYQHQVYTLFCNTYLNVPITYDIQILKYLKSLKKTSVTNNKLKTFIDKMAAVETEYIYKNPIADVFDNVEYTSITRDLIVKMLSNDEHIEKLTLYNNDISADMLTTLCLQILYCIYHINDVNIKQLITDIVNYINDDIRDEKTKAIKAILNAIRPIIPSKLIVDFLTTYVNKSGRINENRHFDDIFKQNELDKTINETINHTIFDEKIDNSIETINADKNFIQLFKNIQTKFPDTAGTKDIKYMMKKLVKFNISHVCSFINKFLPIFESKTCTNSKNIYINNSNILKLFNKYSSQECVNFVKLVKCIDDKYSIYYGIKEKECYYKDLSRPGNYDDREANIPPLENKMLKINISNLLQKSNSDILSDHSALNKSHYNDFYISLKDRVYQIIDNVNPNMLYNLYLNIFGFSDFVDEYRSTNQLNKQRTFDSKLLNNTILPTDNKINDYIIGGSIDTNNDPLHPQIDFKGKNENSRSISLTMILSNYVSGGSSDVSLDNTVFKNIENHELFESNTPGYSTKLSVDITQHNAIFKLFEKEVFNIEYDSGRGLYISKDQPLNSFKLFTLNDNTYYTFNDLLVDILFIIFYEYPKSHGHNFLIDYKADTLNIPMYTISLAEYVDDYSKEYRRSLDVMSKLMKGIAYAYYTKKNIKNDITDKTKNKDYVEGFEYFKKIFYNARKSWTKENFLDRFFTSNPLKAHVEKCIDTYLNKIDCDEYTSNDIIKYTVRDIDNAIENHNIKLNDVIPFSKAKTECVKKNVTIKYHDMLKQLRTNRREKFTEDFIFKYTDDPDCNYVLYGYILDYLDKNIVKPGENVTDINTSGINKHEINFISVYDNYVNSIEEYSLLTNIFAITYAIFKLKIDIDCYINLEVYRRILNYSDEEIEKPSYLHQIYNDSIKPFIIQNFTEVYRMYMKTLVNTYVVTNTQGVVKFMKRDVENVNNKEYADYYNWFNTKVQLTHNDLNHVNIDIKSNNTLRYYRNNNDGSVSGYATCEYSTFDTTFETSLIYEPTADLTDTAGNNISRNLVSFYVSKIGDKRYIFVNDSHLIACYRNILNDYKQELKLQKILNGLEDSNINDYGALFDALKIIACCIIGRENITTYKYLVSNADMLQKMYKTNINIAKHGEYDYEFSSPRTADYMFKTRTMEFLNIYSAICDKYYSREAKLENEVTNTTNTFYPITTDKKDQELAEKFNSAFIKLFYIYNLNFTVDSNAHNVVNYLSSTKLDYISLNLINTPSVDTSVINNTYKFEPICHEKTDSKVNDNAPTTPKSVRYIYYKIFYYIYYILNVMSSNELYCNRYSLTSILNVIHMFFDPKWIENKYYSTISKMTNLVSKEELLNLDTCISNMRIIVTKLANTNMTVFTSMVDYIESYIKNCISICTIQDVMEYHTCNPNIQMISIEALSEAYVDDYEYLEEYFDRIYGMNDNASSQEIVDAIADIYTDNDTDGANKTLASYHYNKSFMNDLTNACYDELPFGTSRRTHVLSVLFKYSNQLISNIKNHLNAMSNNIEKFKKSSDMSNCILWQNFFTRKNVLAQRYNGEDIAKYIDSNINGMKNMINRNVKNIDQLHSDVIPNDIDKYIDIYKDIFKVVDIGYGNNVLYTDSIFGGLYVNLLYNCLMINDLSSSVAKNAIKNCSKFNIFNVGVSFSHLQLYTCVSVHDNSIALEDFVKYFIYSFGDTKDHYTSVNERMYEANRLNIQNDIKRNGGLKGRRKVLSPWDKFADKFLINNSTVENFTIYVPYDLNLLLNKMCHDMIEMNYNDKASSNDDNDIMYLCHVFITYIYCYVFYNLSFESTLNTVKKSYIEQFKNNSRIFKNREILIGKVNSSNLVKMIFDNSPTNNNSFIDCCEELLQSTSYYRSTLSIIKTGVDKIYYDLISQPELSNCNSNALALYKMCALCYIFSLN